MLEVSFSCDWALKVSCLCAWAFVILVIIVKIPWKCNWTRLLSVYERSINFLLSLSLSVLILTAALKSLNDTLNIIFKLWSVKTLGKSSKKPTQFNPPPYVLLTFWPTKIIVVGVMIMLLPCISTHVLDFIFR